MKKKQTKVSGARCLGRLISWLIGVLVVWGMLTVGEVLVLKYVPVTYTPLMLRRALEARSEGRSYEVQHTWVALEDINPELVRAVIASEDNLFLKHNGFSKNGLRQAIKEKREGGKVRHGGSTISQQTAKNVFTSGRRTYVRKVREAWFTFLIEKIWGKRRIMEVYLNVIEMAEKDTTDGRVGVFGAEAASRTFFHHSAANLSRSESALMAVCLPNPRKMFPDHPSAYVRKRQGQIMTLAPKLGKIEL